MNDELRLGDRLRAVASAVDASGDLGQVQSRAEHRRARRRAAGLLAAAVLVAGAGGAGLGLGLAVGGDDDDEQLAGVGEDATGEGTVDTAPPTVAPAATIAPAPASTVPVEADAVATTVPVPATDGRTGAVPIDEFELISDRTTAEGVRVRVHRMPGYGSDMGIPDVAGWEPEAWCTPAYDTRVSVATADAIDVTGTGVFKEVPGEAAVSTTVVGVIDGAPIGLVFVHVADGTTEVRATLGDARDAAAPVDGLAVLAFAGVPYEQPDLAHRLPGLSVELVDAAGARAVDVDASRVWGSPLWDEGCTPPPPELPPAGEQPADPAAAEASIRERFTLLRDRTIPTEDKPELLLDDTGLDEANAELDAGQYAEAARTAVITIDELVFTSPSEAWFRYTLETTAGTFGERYGTASLVEGEWRFPRAVVCQDFALAGIECSPPEAQIFPPSWYERYGQVPPGE